MCDLNAQARLLAEEQSSLEGDGQDFADLLGLSRRSERRFRAERGETNGRGRIYGGQILGQALFAASQTAAADRHASCIQLMFAAGGLLDRPIDFEVTTLQEGQRFSARHVRGAQDPHRTLCDANITFAKTLDSPAHSAPAPTDSGVDLDPETCGGLERAEVVGAREVERVLNCVYRKHRTIDMRAPFPDDLMPGRGSGEPRMRFWIQLRQRLGEDPALHAAAFAYLSDYWINFVACIPHVRAMSDRDATLRVVSLNHAIWFHRPLRADRWLLFDCASPSGAFGRALAIARVYNRDGLLVASATQESLLSPVPDPRSHHP